MGVTLEVMMIWSCRIIGLIMASRHILLLLTLEVEYC